MHGSYVVNVFNFEIQSSTWIVVAGEGEEAKLGLLPSNKVSCFLITFYVKYTCAWFSSWQKANSKKNLSAIVFKKSL